ncbi:2-oxoacid:acceptor oxidoreductase subunit alpha [Thiorhodovibrio frisius]|uniref:2-oxoacid:acceptor oxidoreductase, alpha subunit n=1 Tax=Thiorhodovibrio frisius TaxID=631362 RepID=H8Z1P9_9GAMM|nr:2-oxoacid:acceptor oxidoreductase subunit alpha [Thiorhodovibrio frisius]EIC21494.1 2-oxoacid:acceptor oxidoreductase, alpha subunit [Thiorhodovibrio frisius]WPL24080.1 2-oxoglutarate oxidoreductase subunit KorA [Thiorhodovibrio frisius]
MSDWYQSCAITGSGGSGAVTAGMLVLEAAARAGYYGLMTRSAGPQIRGGESAAMLRFGPAPVTCMGDSFGILAALDWGNFARFAGEIPLTADTLILADPGAGKLPPELEPYREQTRWINLRELADTMPSGRFNMVAVGAIAACARLPLSAVLEAATAILSAKGSEVIAAAHACIGLGYQQLPAEADASPAPSEVPRRWSLSGNEAAGLGALRGGVRFVAAYPITPATEILEWLAPRIARLGGGLLQAEDELASINMIIGSSFGGVPSMTATSGPGLSLMMEGIGLAVASETPIVVINVMRGGPSTGIPTKSEQSDLNIALYGLHGDAPHLVLAALDIADCVLTLHWATRLVEHLQTVAIVLSDQLLGQSRVIVDPPETPDLSNLPLGRRCATADPGADYQRYQLTKDGISPISAPGLTDLSYTADGLEHNEFGTPSSLAGDHLAQLTKRRDKLTQFDAGPLWAEITGAGDLCLLTWGSSHGAVLEAAARLNASGRPTRVLGLRLIAPLQRAALHAATTGTQVWVIELNQDGQLFHYLRSEAALPEGARSFARPGPLPLRPAEILTAIAAEPADDHT